MTGSHIQSYSALAQGIDPNQHKNLSRRVPPGLFTSLYRRMSCAGCSTWTLSSPQTQWTLGILRECDHQIHQLQEGLASRATEIQELRRKNQHLAELQRHAAMREEILTQTISTQKQLIHALTQEITGRNDECMTAQTPPSPFLTPPTTATNHPPIERKQHLSQKWEQI